MRRAPSIHPRYQSGWAGDVTVEALNGPYSQTGLICSSTPIAPITAAMAKKSPNVFAVYVGHSLEPTKLVSVLTRAGNWVWLCRQLHAGWAAIRHERRNGM